MRHRPLLRGLVFSVGIAAGAFALSANAHDFWVQPFQFWIQPNSAVMTSLQVGHGEFRQRWTSDAERVVRFDSLGPDGAVTDHRAELKAGTMNQDHLLKFGAPGTHVLALQSSYAESTLPGIRFTDYIKQEGLTPAIESRTRTRTEDQPGREIYSRRAKALIQVGPRRQSRSPG